MGSLNRRALFSAVPAIMVPLSAGLSYFPLTPGLPDEGEKFLAWERAAQAIDKEISAPDLPDEEVDALSDRRHVFERNIAVTPATTRTAILVKARLLQQDRFNDLDRDGAALVAQLVSYLEAA